MNIFRRVFEVSRTESDKQVSRSLGIFHSKLLRIVSVARSLAFLERVRMCSIVSTLMNRDITDAVFFFQNL